MRDLNRLYDFYKILTTIHMRKFPDWRFGQFMYNFFNWMYTEKNKDIFFPEEEEMLEYLKEFAGITGIKED